MATAEGLAARPVPMTLAELAVRFGCELRGDPDLTVTAVGQLDSGPGHIGFVASSAFRDALAVATVTAVITDSRNAAHAPGAVLVAGNPHATFARIAAVLHPVPAAPPGIHLTACVDPTATVSADAHVGPFAVVGGGATIGPRCVVGPHCIVGNDAALAEDVRLVARVTVCERVSIGARSLLHPGVVAGSDGFGNAREAGRWVKVPQVGSVRIGADVEIGSNTTIDRGALGDTVIEDGARLDNQIQVAHNVVIGAHTAIAACTGIAGSTRIGQRCLIGGGTGIGGQIEIADDVVIAGFGMVTKSIMSPGMYSSVLPVEEVRQWRRIVGRIKRLDTMATRITQLERATGTGGPEQDETND